MSLRGPTPHLPLKKTFPWGSASPTCELANYWPRSEDGVPLERCINDTVPVDSYHQGASPYGVLQLAGNVAEWVKGSFSETELISRGGSLGTGEGSLRTFHRTPEPLEATSNGLGFRCKRFLEE